MKTKIRDLLIIPKLLIILVIIIVSFSFGCYLHNKLFNKFNPDKDVCLQYEGMIVGLVKNSNILICNRPYPKKNDIIDRVNNPNLNIGDGCGECKEWRPKTYCELNPNDETKCTCDENWRKAWDEDGCKNINSFNFDLCTSFYQDKCIKAHEKTECEKGNPNYIKIDECIVDKEFYPTNSYAYFLEDTPLCKNDNTFEECCVKTLNGEIKVRECRKKTIYDYSCKDLKKHIFLEEDYCSSTNKFNINRCPGWNSIIKNIKLKQIYIEKGCEP